MIKTIYVEAPNGGKTLLEGEINRRLREEGVKDEDIMNVSIGPYNNVTIFYKAPDSPKVLTNENIPEGNFLV